MSEEEARVALADAIHAYYRAICSEGDPGPWVLVSELSLIDPEDTTEPLRHGYVYTAGFGASPATAIGLLRTGLRYAEANIGLDGADDDS